MSTPFKPTRQDVREEREAKESQDAREEREAFDRANPVEKVVVARKAIDPADPEVIRKREAFDKRAEQRVKFHQDASDAAAKKAFASDERSAAVRHTDQALKRTPNT